MQFKKRPHVLSCSSCCRPHAAYKAHRVCLCIIPVAEAGICMRDPFHLAIEQFPFLMVGIPFVQ